MNSPDRSNTPMTLPIGSARLWTFVLCAGIVAGLAAWLGGEACRDLIKPIRHAVNSKGLVLNVTDRREESVADAKNAGLAFIILGAALGSGLGIAGGFVRRSVRSAASAGLLGLAVGAGAAGVTSLVLLPAYNAYKQRHPDEALQDLTLPLLVHLGIWSATGAAGGLAFGIGPGARGRLAAPIVGGAVGAVVATIGYELIGAMAFPAAKTAQFVSLTRETRLMARLAVTVLASAGAAMGYLSSSQRPDSPTV